MGGPAPPGRPLDPLLGHVTCGEGEVRIYRFSLLVCLVVKLQPIPLKALVMYAPDRASQKIHLCFPFLEQIRLWAGPLNPNTSGSCLIRIEVGPT